VAALIGRRRVWLMALVAGAGGLVQFLLAFLGAR
jgi:hypothetical protein